MAWNEPGNNDKDPWKNKGGNNQGPPDLDDLFKDLGNKMNGIFGGKSGGGNSGGTGSAGGNFSGVAVTLALVYCINCLSYLRVYTPSKKLSAASNLRFR